MRVEVASAGAAVRAVIHPVPHVGGLAESRSQRREMPDDRRLDVGGHGRHARDRRGIFELQPARRIYFVLPGFGVGLASQRADASHGRTLPASHVS